MWSSCVHWKLKLLVSVEINVNLLDPKPSLILSLFFLLVTCSCRPGVSIIIEVARMFEYSNQTHQQGAISPVFLVGSGGEIQCSHNQLTKA